MARKRKISQSSDSDEFVITSDSDADEAYTPRAAGSSRASSTKNAVKKTRAPSKKPPGKKPRKGKVVVDGDDASDDDDDSTEGRVYPHAASAHTITQAKGIRTALLAWYDTVHDVRGMPWRKPFSHAWNSEERAQRAYEVSSTALVLPLLLVSLTWPNCLPKHRSGYLKSCCNRRRSSR